MKQKKTKAVVVILALLLSFFGSKTTLAYTELYSDDFDSYYFSGCGFSADVPVGGWLRASYSPEPICLTQENSKSFPNSIFCETGAIGCQEIHNNDLKDYLMLDDDRRIKRVISFDAYFDPDEAYPDSDGIYFSLGLILYDGQTPGRSYAIGGFNFFYYYKYDEWTIRGVTEISTPSGGSAGNSGFIFTDWTDDDIESRLLNRWVNVALEIDYHYPLSGTITSSLKLYIDNEFAIGAYNENVRAFEYFAPSFSMNRGQYIDNFSISTSLRPPVVNGECGAYNGQEMTLQDFDASSNTGKCAKGDYTNFWNDGLFGYWVCKGSDDGSDDVCSVSWEVQNGACGAYNGQKMTLQDFDASSNTGKCAVGEYKNFSSDLLNGYWTCGGVAMGNDVNCGVEWRDEDEVILPDLPDLEDCSSLSIPNKWFCEMRNFFLSAFFPSADKMNDLTGTIDRMKNKAPFNYLRLVKDKFDSLNENIQETDQVEISLLGNTGTIDIDQIPLRKIIFDCFSIMVVIGFAFWALKYIKSIF